MVSEFMVFFHVQAQIRARSPLLVYKVVPVYTLLWFRPEIGGHTCPRTVRSVSAIFKKIGVRVRDLKIFDVRVRVRDLKIFDVRVRVRRQGRTRLSADTLVRVRRSLVTTFCMTSNGILR